MAYLHNRISQKELKEQLYKETFKRITVSFYKYFPVYDPQKCRDDLYLKLNALKVFGRIYIAHEGINAQVSVPEYSFEEFKEIIELALSNRQLINDNQITSNDHLKTNENLSLISHPSLRFNIAVNDNGKSFWVLKIKVRDKIVTDGITDPGFSMEKTGNYVDAEQFNALTNDTTTIVVDMRNHYEYEVGHFSNALEIPSDTFREQLPMAVEMLEDKKDTTIIMYCTGGIRCEKASAYLLHHGFKNVFHLEGGIINYANTVKEKHIENKFLGKNFVFDDRLGEKIGDEIISKCHQCGKPTDTHVNCINPGCHLLFIQCDECKVKYEQCCSSECQVIIHLPEEEQMKIRKGVDKGRNVFNKSKKRLHPKLNE
ncbi:MAG: rhodanese-related sulfurtransferase [Fimbriimonadaceae bacterium]|nr:rhodanese-related sulfurtransferase [Chitinophagales bacterium]